MNNKKLATTARILLGSALIIFGLNGFFQFLPMPALPEPAADFMGALMQTGYLMSLVKALEVVLGVLLVSNRLVPLALVLLAPISVNIFAFHLFLDPAGIGGAALVTVLNVYLLYTNREHYLSLVNKQQEEHVPSYA